MTLERLSSTLASLAVLFLVIAFGALAFVMAMGVYEGTGYPADFIAFWAAAQLADQGQATAAFDFEALNAAYSVPSDFEPRVFLWMYPPMFHAVIWPLGWLPYWIAHPLFAFGALMFFLWALRPYQDAWPGGLNFVLIAPVVLIGTLNGNNGLLTAGLLVWALTSLRHGREAQAGLLIALLTIKPTLGLILPVALLAGGHWRAFLWACLGTVVFAVSSSLIMGWDYWAVFFEYLGQNASRVAEGKIPMEVTVTWYGFFYNIGAGAGIGFGVQIAMLIFSALIIGWVFARPGEWAWKGAFLFILTPLATPYAHFYEMAFTLAGTLMLTLAGGVRNGAEKALVIALWILPVFVTFLRDPPVVAYFAAPLMTALVVLAVLRARRAWA